MFRAIVEMVVLLATAMTNAFVSLNHLMRAAAERTSIVEDKSVRAAALSSLRGETDFINEYSELEKRVKGVTATHRKDAESYLQKFRDARTVRTI
jgi:hypothetical protein